MPRAPKLDGGDAGFSIALFTSCNPSLGSPLMITPYGLGSLTRSTKITESAFPSTKELDRPRDRIHSFSQKLE